LALTPPRMVSLCPAPPDRSPTDGSKEEHQRTKQP
jgi:hypothetical protein